MSKIAEEKALERFPVEMTPLVYQDLIEYFGGKTEVDFYMLPRSYFQLGYEQAEKDFAMSYPMPEDTILFQKGVEEGRRLEREDFPDNLSWRDIKRIVQIADNMLDDPKMRVAVQNHSDEEYYKNVWKKWRKTVSD